MCVCACVRACACMCASVRACVCVCARARACVRASERACDTNFPFIQYRTTSLVLWHCVTLTLNESFITITCSSIPGPHPHPPDGARAPARVLPVRSGPRGLDVAGAPHGDGAGLLLQHRALASGAGDRGATWRQAADKAHSDWSGRETRHRVPHAGQVQRSAIKCSRWSYSYCCIVYCRGKSDKLLTFVLFCFFVPVTMSM